MPELLRGQDLSKAQGHIGLQGDKTECFSCDRDLVKMNKPIGVKGVGRATEENVT